MSVAFSTFGDALAGILVGELHRHAMSEAKKGIILRAHLRFCRTQLLIFVTILLQPRQNASRALAAAGQRSMNHVDRSNELQVFNLIALLLRSAVLTWDYRYHSKLAICLRTKMALYSTVAIFFSILHDVLAHVLFLQFVIMMQLHGCAVIRSNGVHVRRIT